MTDHPTLDEDVVRAARLDSLGTLLSRILNGLVLTPDEGKLLSEHIDAEVRESTTARAVAVSNKRHVQAIAPEIDRLTAELEDAETRAEAFRQQRGQAQAALARVHRLADLIAAGAPWTANHDNLAGRIRDAATVPGEQPAPPAPVDWQGVLRGFQALLAAFPADLHPGGPAVSCRPQPAQLVARWRDTARTARQQYAADFCCGKPPGATCVHDTAPATGQTTKEK